MSPPKILVVEDESIVALSICSSLKSLGYEVADIADSAEKALEKAHLLQPDLILMDITLKGKADGIAVSEQIQQQKSIPIIYLTAYFDGATTERMRPTNPYGYLVKPFKLPDLKAAIEVALLRVAYERQAQKNYEERIQQLRSTILGNMSHEVHTPMNAILGFCQLLKYEISNADLQPYLDAIMDNGNMLIQLFDDILQLSRLESDLEEIVHNQEINLPSLLEEIQQIFYPKIIEKKLNLVLEILAVTPNIWFNKSLLRQILINLVSNAIKFSDRGDIKIQANLEEQITFPRNKPSHTLILTVADQGIGMTSQQQQNIFQTFSQVDSSLSRPYGGMGLGLALVYRLTQKLGGIIEVESQLNQGTTFRLTFPNITIFQPLDYSSQNFFCPAFLPKIEINPELEQQLPELLQILQNLEHEDWQIAAETFIFKHLKDLKEKLMKLATEYPYLPLVMYAQDFQRQLQELNTEFFTTLENFPQLVRTLEQHLNNSK
jgi:signal transduction histidine kinase